MKSAREGMLFKVMELKYNLPECFCVNIEIDYTEFGLEFVTHGHDVTWS